MLQFDRARWQRDSEGVWLCIRASVPAAAMSFCETMVPGKLYDAELKKHRNRRSLDANAYCWVLLGKLAAKLGITPEEAYRQYVPDIGDNYTIVPVKEGSLAHWDRIWTSGHIGRSTRDMGPCRTLPGYRSVASYIGSSDYDTAQMSRLLALIAADCKEHGIETMTPRELSALTDRWGKVYGNR